MSKRLRFTRTDLVGSGDKLAPPAFLCSARRGRFSAPANLMPSIARSDGREHGAYPDWKCDDKAANDLNERNETGRCQL
jgi:hypothetical protein